MELESANEAINGLYREHTKQKCSNKIRKELYYISKRVTKVIKIANELANFCNEVRSVESLGFCHPNS